MFFPPLFLYKQAGFRALTEHFGAQNPMSDHDVWTPYIIN